MNIFAVLLALGVLTTLGIAFGGMLTVAAKKFEIEEDERTARVRECLPGANCGACGFVGCDSFAQAVVDGAAQPNGCVPGGQTAASAIGEVLGVEVIAAAPVVARVLCQGTKGVARDSYIYDGLKSCRVAASLSGGPKDCRFACVGLGDCAFACKFNAITLNDGIAVVDDRLCVGCGACVDVCPRAVIELKPVEATVLVRCRNSDVAREARAVCMKACMGCKRCVKECKYDAIAVVDGFARIDYEKCTRCGDCVRVCPSKGITLLGENPDDEVATA